MNICQVQPQRAADTNTIPSWKIHGCCTGRSDEHENTMKDSPAKHAFGDLHEQAWLSASLSPESHLELVPNILSPVLMSHIPPLHNVESLSGEPSRFICSAQVQSPGGAWQPCSVPRDIRSEPYLRLGVQQKPVAKLRFARKGKPFNG